MSHPSPRETPRSRIPGCRRFHTTRAEHFDRLEPLFNGRAEHHDGRVGVPEGPDLAPLSGEWCRAWTTEQATADHPAT